MTDLFLSWSKSAFSILPKSHSIFAKWDSCWTDVQVWLLACMLLVFLSLVEYAIILRKIVIHQRNLEKWRQEQIKEKKQDQSSEVGSNVANVLKIFYCCYIAAAILGVVIAQRRWKWRDQHKGKTTPNWNKASSQNFFFVFEVAGSNKLQLVAISMQNWIKICKYFCQVTEMTNGSKKHTSKWKAKVRKNRCHIVAEVKYRYHRILVCCNFRFIIFRPNCPSSS